MIRDAFVAFRWGDEAVAVPAGEVTVILDRAAEGALPGGDWGGVRRVIACQGELGPVVEAAAPHAGDSPFVVLLHHDGNLALNVPEGVQVRYGAYEGTRVVWDDGAQARVVRRQEWLQNWLRRLPERGGA